MPINQPDRAIVTGSAARFRLDSAVLAGEHAVLVFHLLSCFRVFTLGILGYLFAIDSMVRFLGAHYHTTVLLHAFQKFAN